MKRALFKLRLTLGGLVCWAFGHNADRVIRHDEHTVTVGDGCGRCGAGEVRRYALAGPLPAHVREYLAPSKG